jgi:hypothetical protein
MADQKTCFKKVDYDLSDLLHYVDLGDIGLPDIQRPFVWSNAKVRDLFDSMYKDPMRAIGGQGGYPWSVERPQGEDRCISSRDPRRLLSTTTPQ